jgi:uncharacterized protein (TIGR03083 family)
MTAMIPNAEIAAGIITTYEDFAVMLDGLDDSASRAPTRCTGWEVRDVAAHVVGLAADAMSGVPGSRTPDEHAAALRDHPPAELAALLRASVATLRGLISALDDAAWNGPSGVPGMTLARGVHGLWFDAWVHLDDARAALGVPADNGPGLAASSRFVVDRLREAGWGPATIALDGIAPLDIGTGGPRITGDPHHFVLVATGRADPSTLGLDETVNVYREP